MKRPQTAGIDAQQRNIGDRIGTDDLGDDLASVGQPYADAMSANNDMPICDDQSVLPNDEPRAKCAGRAFVTPCVTTRRQKEASNDCAHCIGIGVGHRSSFGARCGPIRRADRRLYHENGYYT